MRLRDQYRSIATPASEVAVRLAQVPLLRHLSNMADHPNIKPDALQLVEALPESATWDDLAYEVYVRQAVASGLSDAEAGRMVSHEDAMARIRNRIRRAS